MKEFKLGMIIISRNIYIFIFVKIQNLLSFSIFLYMFYKNLLYQVNLNRLH